MQKARRNRFLAALAMCIVALAMVCCVTGCRDTDVLKEIVYDQSSENIDYDNETKYYISDSTAKETSDLVSAVEVEQDAPVTDEVQNLVVYSSDPNTSYRAKKSLLSKTPDFYGIEASESVSFYLSNDKNAIDHKVADEEEPEEEEKEPEEAPTTVVENYTGDDGNGEEGTGESNSGEEESPEETDDGSGKGDDVEVAYDSNDPNQETPTVDSVAAYGAYAAIVQLVGGDGALAATDKNTLKGTFADVVDTKNIAQGWSDGGTAKKMNVNAIVKSGAKAILAPIGTYLDKLSSADKKKLKDAGCNLVVVKTLTTSSNIKSVVKTVAKLLKESKTAEYASTAVKRAEKYEEFHDRVVAEAADANGGLEGTKQYQSKKDSSYTKFAKDDETYTLLIDSFDESATFIGAAYGKSKWKPSDGLAFSKAGYNTTPVSYYIQAGGVINNAADRSTENMTGLLPVWQFQGNTAPFRKDEWSSKSVSSVSSAAEKALRNDSLLTTSVGEVANSSTSLNFGESFGTDTFPKIIVMSSDDKEAVIKNSKDANSTMHPYGLVEGATTYMYGVDAGSSLTIPACIGFSMNNTGEENILGDSIPEERIEVNPTGLLGDWTEGTVESFLEAAWVSDVVVDSDENDISWKSEAKSFYSQFFDYELTESDFDTMTAGRNE